MSTDDEMLQCWCGHVCMHESGIGVHRLGAVIKATRCLTAVGSAYNGLPRLESLTVRNLAQAHAPILRDPAGANGLHGSGYPASSHRWNRLGMDLLMDLHVF